MRRIQFLLIGWILLPAIGFGQQPVWTHNAANSIQTLSGGSVSTLVDDGPVTPWGIAYNRIDQKIYWTNVLEGTIKRSDLNGGGTETVQTGLDLPRGLAVDAQRNLLFWVEAGHSNPRLRKMNLADGTIEDLVTESIISPHHIALDTQHRRIYWVDNALSQKVIRRTSYDGGNMETIITSVNQVSGITVAQMAGKIFWADFGDDNIYSADTTGQDQNINTIVSIEEDATPWAIIFDQDLQKIYWTDYLNGSIHRADADGTNATELASGITAPSGINTYSLCPVLSGGRLFVKQGSSGAGSSWDQALPELRDALGLLAGGPCTATNVNQIWVASGVYAPAEADNPENVTTAEREQSFQLMDGIKLYGGFSGSENPSGFTLDDRNISENPTVLTGNIVNTPSSPQQAMELAGSLGEYSYSVVTALGTDDTAQLNGFVITGGNADGIGGNSSEPQQSGGGIYIDGGSPMLKNLSITGNAASSYGGGIFSTDSSSPVLINVSIFKNQAAVGGGLANGNASSPQIIHTTLAMNSASDKGGGIYNYQNSSPSITNSIIWDNDATNGGDQILNDNSTPLISHSLIEGSGGSSSWDPNLGTDNGNNLDQAPLFVDAANNNVSLMRESPAIDAGTSNPFDENEPAAGTETDLAGNNRHFGPADLGAYESGTATTINGNQGTEDWRFLASPAANATLANLFAPFWTQGIPGADYEGGASSLYLWDGQAGQFTAPASMNNEAPPGQGYITYIYDDQDYDEQPEGFPKDFAVTGASNRNDVDVEVISTSNGAPENQRWNLLGNPFGFSLNVSEVLDLLDEPGTENVQVNRNVYIWNPDKEHSGGGFGAYEILEDTPGDPAFIPPFQSFFVRYEQPFAGSQTVTFDRQSLVDLAASRTLFGKEDAGDKNPIAGRLNIELLGEQTGSQFQLVMDKRVESVNSPYNAYQLTPLKNRYALLSATKDGHNYARVHLPATRDEEVAIPLELSTTAGGDYTIRWNGISEGYQTMGHFVLVDSKTGNMYELNQPGEFSFNFGQLAGSNMRSSVEKEGSSKTSIIDSFTVELAQDGSPKSKNAGESRFTLYISAPGQLLDNPGQLPEKVALQQNYPNPFNPTTQIEYSIPQETHVRLEVFDIIGRRVAVLVNERVGAGSYNVTFNAGNLSSGVYIYKLEALGRTHIKKLTLIK